MLKTERIKKNRKKAAGKKSSLLSELAEVSTDIDMPDDFSKQHDHYLYGIPKK